MASFKILLLFALAGVIASNAKIKGLKILEFDFVLTIVGVLLGFGLSIYTFSVQLLQPIIENVEKKIDNKERQERIIKHLKSGILELREDLWLLFFSLLIVLVVGVTSNSTELKFNIGVYPICYLAETIYITVYLIALRAVSDLMKSLFRVGEITVELLDYNKPKNDK